LTKFDPFYLENHKSKVKYVTKTQSRKFIRNPKKKIIPKSTLKRKFQFLEPGPFLALISLKCQEL